MAKLAMAPPVELMVNPVAAVLTVRFSDEAESVKAGAASAAVTVNVNVAVVEPLALVAVTVYAVAPATDVGVPVSAPVEVLKLIPAGVALMAKLAMAPPVELMVNPVATVLTVLVSDEEERVKAGAASAGAAAAGSGAGVAGSGAGVAVVIDAEIAEGSEEPAVFIAVNVNV